MDRQVDAESRDRRVIATVIVKIGNRIKDLKG